MASYPADRPYLFAAGMLLACGANEPSDPTGNAGVGSNATGGAVAGSGGGTAGLVSGGAAATGGLAGNGSTSLSGTAGSVTESGGGGGTAGGAVDCESENPSSTFEENCLACAKNDCERCLCTNCLEPLQTCAETSGCPEIAACVEASGCG